MYIIELTKENQKTIKEYLIKLGITGEDLELFKKVLSMLDDVEDVQNVYHNAILPEVEDED